MSKTRLDKKMKYENTLIKIAFLYQYVTQTFSLAYENAVRWDHGGVEWTK